MRTNYYAYTVCKLTLFSERVLVVTDFNYSTYLWGKHSNTICGHCMIEQKRKKKLRPIFHKYESISFFTLWAIVGNSSRVFTPSIILYLLNHLNLTIIMFTVKDASLIFLTNTLVLFVEKYTEYFSMASFLFFLKRAVFFTKWKQPPLRSNNHIVLRCHSVSDCKSFPNDL